MKRITWATMATASPMGQQVYEREIQRAIGAIEQSEWTFKSAPVTSLRSRIPGARRAPMGAYESAAPLTARLIGLGLYGPRAAVHRFDLRIPPALSREVVTIHDLPPLRFPDEGDIPKSAAAGARNARVVICPSEFAANEVHELLGIDAERTRVIPYGLAEDYLSPVPADDATLDRLGIRAPFVIHAAGATQRKNLSGLAEAWRRVSASVPEASLVLCGPPHPHRTELFEAMPSVVLAGRLPSEVIAALMCRSAAVVVPSIYEGFGLPALEGMACGRPVVAVRAGALPEVCGDAAIMVEPSGEDLARGLLVALTDAAEADRVAGLGLARARQFSWPLAAERHLEVYREVFA